MRKRNAASAWAIEHKRVEVAQQVTKRIFSCRHPYWWRWWAIQKDRMDMFQEEGTVGYQLACAAAIQNMLLAAHALNLGSLFSPCSIKTSCGASWIFRQEKTPLALVCIGKPKDPQNPAPRKDSKEKTVYLD